MSNDILTDLKFKLSVFRAINSSLQLIVYAGRKRLSVNYYSKLQLIFIFEIVSTKISKKFK